MLPKEERQGPKCQVPGLLAFKHDSRYKISQKVVMKHSLELIRRCEEPEHFKHNLGAYFIYLIFLMILMQEGTTPLVLGYARI